MSTSQSQCCLCCKIANSYKLMQNELGECTEEYNVTVKYFDPIMEVVKSRSLLDVMTQDVLDVKLEEQLIPVEDKESSDENEYCDLISSVEDEKNTVEIIIERDFSRDTQNEAINEESDFSDSKGSAGDLADENTTRRKSYKSGKRNTSTKDEIVCNKVKTSNRGRKSKSVAKDSTKAVYTLEKGRELDSFIAQWKPNLECDLCPETATSFDALRSHFREVHNSRFYIKCCDRKFYRRCILVDHIRLHVNPDKYKCEICGKSSTSKYNLKLHKQIVHNEDRHFECEICHKNFNHKPTLDRHLLTHVKGDKEFFCKECNKGYVLEVQLNTHMRNVHNGIRICEQCGKTFQSVGALKKHLMEHGIIPQPKFTCDICGVELKSNEALKRHKAAYHHDGSTAYICSICAKVASSEHALLSHKKFVHEDKRKHKCNFCEKAFRTRTVLREHIATHTGEDLYQCQHCPQTFKTNANMHHHRKRVHPVEWKAARKHRLNIPKVNVDQLRRQVII